MKSKPTSAHFISDKMQQMLFALGKFVELEESLTCEFKEVAKGQSPIQAIGKIIDRYAVAFLNETSGSVFWANISSRGAAVASIKWTRAKSTRS